MAADPLLYATPVFAIGLVVEGLATRYSPRALLSGLGCLAVDQILAAWGLGVFVVAFAALHAHAALAEPGGAWRWIVAVAVHDAAYYAFHRASHRVGVLWAAHVVHHQSERYDLTVSLRQGAAATWISYAFYLPAALVIDARAFLIVHAAYQVYQFFVHTRAVRTLGPLEWLLATPSHHRVHHGSEARHLDRNYGGFFIVLDRLLGTFAPEGDREPRYGVPGGFDIASPAFANSYMFLRLVAASAGASVRDLVRLWLGPPERSAHRLSSAGHAPRAVEAISRRTALLLAAGAAAALAVTLADLPLPLAIAAGALGLVLIELALAPLDGR